MSQELDLQIGETVVVTPHGFASMRAEIREISEARRIELRLANGQRLFIHDDNSDAWKIDKIPPLEQLAEQGE